MNCIQHEIILNTDASNGVNDNNVCQIQLGFNLAAKI